MYDHSLCTRSIFARDDLVVKDQIRREYLVSDAINEFAIILRLSNDINIDIRLKAENLALAFLHNALTCFVKERALSKLTPYNVTLLHSLKTFPLKVIKTGESLDFPNTIS